MYRIGQEEIDELAKVIRGGNLFRVDSPYLEVETFEKAWAEKIGTRHALCVNGGTSALICGLVGLGIGPGDEVIVPGYTFMASALAVLAVGAIPVIAEVDETLTLSPEDVKRKISRHTRALMPVHMLGFPCDMDALMDIAGNSKIKVLEDACQADGGSWGGKRLGSVGDAGAFSFNHYKILSAGDAGCMVTDDRKVYERAMIYHDGVTFARRYVNEISTPLFTGVQNRVGELTGAVLRVQLGRLEGILSDLRRVKKEFIAGLAGKKNIEFARSNDPEGDCGTTLAFRFPSEEDARKFVESDGVDGSLPIDSGRHVYANWTPILEKRGAHHPALNPFNMRENSGLNMEYGKDMCPGTLDILKRTVLIPVNPDWSAEETASRIESCRIAGESL